MSWLKRHRKQPGWLALSVHADRVDLVHAKRTVGGRPELALCDSFRKEGSDVDTLTRLRRELTLEQYRCTTLLPANEYQLHQIEAPSVPAAEMKSAVRWRVKDEIDYPVDAATVEIFEIPSLIEGGSAQSLYAVTAPNEAIARRIKPFDSAQVPLEVIDIGELAQRNIAALFEPQGEGLALLAFYAEDGMLTFTRGGELYAARRIEVSVTQLMDDDDAQRAEAFERVTLAVQRSLDYFEREFSVVPLGKLVLAPLPKDVGLLEHLQSEIDGRVEGADLAEVMDLAAVPELKRPERQAHFLPMIGAALREEIA